MLDQSLSQFLLFVFTAMGAVIAALWLGMVLWTIRDIRARVRDPLAQIAAALLVAALNVVGLLLYALLRPHETLTEAYERSLEEEALLQGIEEKPMCPGCGRPTNARWQVCPACHTRLKKSCTSCGELLDLPWNICPYCATPQKVAAERPGRRTESSGQTVRMPNADSAELPLEYVDNDDE